MQHMGLHVPKPRVRPLLSPSDGDFASVSACAGAPTPTQDLKGFACWGKPSQSSSCSLPCSFQAPRSPQCSEDRRSPVLLPGSPSTGVWSYARHRFPLFLQPGEAWGRALRFNSQEIPSAKGPAGRECVPGAGAESLYSLRTPSHQTLMRDDTARPGGAGWGLGLPVGFIAISTSRGDPGLTGHGLSLVATEQDGR